MFALQRSVIVCNDRGSQQSQRGLCSLKPGIPPGYTELLALGLTLAATLHTRGPI